MPPSDVPLEPAPAEAHRPGAVLFDVPADRLAALAAELRRLGRRPVRFRWLPTADDEPGRVLVRVEDPPPLVVWRVLDEVGGFIRVDLTLRVRKGPAAPEALSATPGPAPLPHAEREVNPEAGPAHRPILAFAEHAPGVWVQLGYRHPHVEQVRPPKKHILLLRAPGTVETLPVGAFSEEVDTLTLAPAPAPHAPGAPIPPIAARLRLVRGEDHEPPRLWVLREDALAQLTAYCRTAHQHLLNRFTLAASVSAGVPCVVLRAESPRGPPPVFVGPAGTFRPLARLPNLYLPGGMRLAPVLRPDALRKALGLSPERVAWLHPLGDGGFRVESLPEAAFRPLRDWVEYRVPNPATPGQPWVQSHRWELPTFVERPDARPVPAPPKPAEPARAATPDRAGVLKRTVAWIKKLRGSPRPTPLAEERAVPAEELSRTFLSQGDRLHHARPAAVNPALDRSRDLEARFLQTLPTLAPDHQTDRWAELAATYEAIDNHADAALCWLNALWGRPNPPPDWVWQWLVEEARAGRPEVKAIDPAPWLAGAPGPGTTRALAAWVVWAAHQSPPHPFLTERLSDIQARLEAHEHWLPVRAAWLARAATARLGRVDVLGLARTRDRLADRLLTAGLSLELDTPSFLRFAGEGVRERFQEARRWLADRRNLVYEWVARLPEDAPVRAGPTADPRPIQEVGLTPDVAHTAAYADLILTWGLTRFAEHSAAENVRRKALAALPADDPVHAVLRDAFEFRIAQVREGKPPRGPLPPALLRRIDGLTGIGRYAVDKLREHSRVLEPTVRVGGYRDSIYRKSAAFAGSAAAALDALPADRLDREIGPLLRAAAERGRGPRLAELTAAALDRASELTEAGVGSALEHLPAALDAAWEDPATLTRLMEKGWLAAAQWDRADVARDLAARLLHMADGRAGWAGAEALIGQAVRALRRLGLKTDADRLLQHVADHVQRGQPLSKLRADRPAEWPAALRVLLHAAAGWYYAGRDEQAHAILDEARRDLFNPATSVKDRTALAVAYTATLGQAPVRLALGRLEELFRDLRGIAVGGTTNAYYSLQPLVLVETAVRAVVSDEFALGPPVRAWLDADELAVRRRIRDELKEVMAGQGW